MGNSNVGDKQFGHFCCGTCFTSDRTVGKASLSKVCLLVVAGAAVVAAVGGGRGGLPPPWQPADCSAVDIPL